MDDYILGKLVDAMLNGLIMLGVIALSPIWFPFWLIHKLVERIRD